MDAVFYASNYGKLGSANTWTADNTFNVIKTQHCDAATSAGVHIGNNTHSDVAIFGAGGGQGTTFYGQINGTSASLSSATASTNTTTGALVLTAGGLGVAGAGNFGGGITCTTLSATSTTASTSTTTGCATFGGGIGVAGAVFSGSLTTGAQSGSNAVKALFVADTTTAAAPQHLTVGIPNVVGNRSGVLFSAVNGSLVVQSSVSGFASEIVSGTTYPNVIGKLDIVVQNGATTTTAATFSATGSLAVTAGITCTTLAPSDNISMAGTKYIYLRGDATTDGSCRMSSPTSGEISFEIRASGTWVEKQVWS